MQDASHHQRIRNLEQAVAQLLGRTANLPDRLALAGRSLQVRLAQTVDDPDDSSYPDAVNEPNVYWIRFIQGTPGTTPGPGSIAATPRQAEPFTTVYNLLSGPGSYIPEDTYIWVFEFGGYWYTATIGQKRPLAIDFTLLEALTTATEHATADVELYYDGEDPDPEDEGIEVYNKVSNGGAAYMFAGATGAKGMALYDARNGVYRIWQLDCPQPE